MKLPREIEGLDGERVVKLDDCKPIYGTGWLGLLLWELLTLERALSEEILAFGRNNLYIYLQKFPCTLY